MKKNCGRRGQGPRVVRSLRQIVLIDRHDGRKNTPHPVTRAPTLSLRLGIYCWAPVAGTDESVPYLQKDRHAACATQSLKLDDGCKRNADESDNEKGEHQGEQAPGGAVGPGELFPHKHSPDG